MTLAKISEKFRMTIPPEAREKLHIDIGDIVEIHVKADEIILRPKKLIDSSQAWFWSKEWQQKEKESQEDYASGRYKSAKNVKEFLTKLREEK